MIRISTVRRSSAPLSRSANTQRLLRLNPQGIPIRRVVRLDTLGQIRIPPIHIPGRQPSLVLCITLLRQIPRCAREALLGALHQLEHIPHLIVRRLRLVLARLLRGVFGLSLRGGHGLGAEQLRRVLLVELVHLHVAGALAGAAREVVLVVDEVAGLEEHEGDEGGACAGGADVVFLEG